MLVEVEVEEEEEEEEEVKTDSMVGMTYRESKLSLSAAATLLCEISSALVGPRVIPKNTALASVVTVMATFPREGAEEGEPVRVLLPVAVAVSVG